MWRRRGPRVAGYRNAIAAPLYLRHQASLAHDTGPHPERPDRIRALEDALGARDWLGYEVREAPPATEEQLLRVHPRTHVDAVREHCERGQMFDFDTTVSPGSWDAALRAAGAACALTEALLDGSAPTGFCGVRPPGHHAEADRAMGFCLFSNVAVAARHALSGLGAERVLVLDFDVHHGNGTNAIFRSDPAVLFASIHQWPFYPGTGALADAGSGAGEGYSINLPAPAGSGEDVWLGYVEHIVAPVAREYRPDLLLVSAGFDAHRDDPLGECRLETASFAQLASHLRALGDEVSAPVGAVLEGGYDLGALASSALATMEALAAGDGAEPRPVARGALVDAAAEQVSRYWPV